MKETKDAAYTDLEVIDLVLNGQMALYEIIVRRYNPVIYKVGRAYGYNHHDTEDLMQETYVSVFKDLRRFENRSSFKTWITRIMLNQCFQKKQKFSFQREISTKDSITEYSTPMFSYASDNTYQKILNAELRHVIEAALLKIPEDYRLVFVLRELSGLNVSEASKALDISESNVKVKLNRAKGMLRNEISNMYSPEEIFEFNLVYCDAMIERVLEEIYRQSS